VAHVARALAAARLRVTLLAIPVTLIFLGGLPAPALDQSEPQDPSDPRVLEADSDLADRATYPDAIALYRAYLGEHPEDGAVRLRLARVLSWNNELDAALREYDELVTRGEPDRDIAVERAEVLSWAGRYRESETAFQAILDEESDHARAARGLARVYLWSGRAFEADRAYVRALEIDDDPEARRERDGLRSLYRPRVTVNGSRRADNADFDFDRLETRGSAYLDLRTRAHADVAYLHSGGLVPRVGGGHDRERRDGVAYSVGLERHLGPSWLASASLGHLAWADAPDHIIAGAGLRYTPNDQTAITFEYLHTGAAEDLDSFAAIDEGIRWDEVGLSLWQQLPRRFDLWGRASGGWLSDSNARFRGEAALGYRPFEERALRIALASSYLTYRDSSDFYYDPEREVETQIQVEYEQPLWRGLRFQVGAGSGFGITRQDGRSTSGFAYHTSSHLFWEWRKWALELGATFAQSRRDSAYRSHHFTAGISRTF
jgi:tetratricopeptide (TPR) repeat protein